VVEHQVHFDAVVDVEEGAVGRVEAVEKQSENVDVEVRRSFGEEVHVEGESPKNVLVGMVE